MSSVLSKVEAAFSEADLRLMRRLVELASDKLERANGKLERGSGKLRLARGRLLPVHKYPLYHERTAGQKKVIQTINETLHRTVKNY